MGSILKNVEKRRKDCSPIFTIASSFVPPFMIQFLQYNNSLKPDDGIFICKNKLFQGKQ